MLGLEAGDGAVVAAEHEASEGPHDGVVRVGRKVHFHFGPLQVGVAEGLSLAVSHGLLSCVSLL